MKKFMGIILSVMLVLSVSAPVFAAELNATTPSGDTVVKTSTQREGEDTDASSFVVTIPAEITSYWEKEGEQNADYTVKSQLPIGKTLAVAVTAKDGGKMTAAGTTDTLSLAVASGANQTFPAVNDGVTGAVRFTISGWSAVPVGVYTGHLTYAVTVA